MRKLDGRRFEAELAPLVRHEDGMTVLRAPRPGWLRRAPAIGRVLREGEALGELEVLGTLSRLIVPAGVAGVVVRENEHLRLARKPVAYGDVLAVLDPRVGAGEVVGGASAGPATASTGLVWKAPLGGRYYGRPSPGAEPFVKAGDTVRAGQTVALIEVMKTFNRASYGGAGLPEQARVVRIAVGEGDDVHAGDVILELEPG
jgi:acetyl-CoA carboxylase biotin carboxyl carrier protein